MENSIKQIKKLAILGSTGSIGQQTLDVVRALPERFKITGLAAGSNIDELRKQIAEFKPKLIYSLSKSANINSKGASFASLEEIAADPEVDIVVIGTSGKAGLKAVIAALKAGKKIALSNKEPLVMAGEIVKSELAASSGEILPVDSEHSAIWQCLLGEQQKPARIILTASGGPFLKYTKEQLKSISVEQALKHPSWKMGKKVTIDSATLMNKGLEVIEAHWLFDVPYENIDILIHPQSIIHSMVKLADGSIKAQLSYPDMRFPIQFALTYPDRAPNTNLPELDWSRISELKFELPDYNQFPCLKLAVEAGRKGGTYPAALCGADEAAVNLFMQKRIALTEISELVEKILNEHNNQSRPDLTAILETDEAARRRVTELVNGAK
jgi:1-deoxy-D-xylulose-5-phosphate reductoisomerase